MPKKSKTNKFKTTIFYHYNKLELIQGLIQVRGELKESINTDYVLARFNEKEIEFITEMTGNAYYGKTLVDNIKNKATKWII